MALKEHLKKALPLPGGGFQWAWKGQGDVRHTVDWAKDGTTVWTVWHGELPMRQEQPWFLVKARGEVQENIKLYRLSGLDLIHANRAMLAVGLLPDQHTDSPGCLCFRCTALLEPSC